MNHKFKSLAGAPATCSKCNHPMMAHTEFATCSVCNKFPCTVNDELMCEACALSEVIAKADIAANANKVIPEPIARIENERFASPAEVVRAIASTTSNYSALTDLPQNNSEFFNAETISHIDLEKRIMADESVPTDKKWFFYVEQLQRRQRELQQAIVTGIELVKEARDRNASVQRSINVLSDKLRAEEKAKLKLHDINYKPVIAPKKVKARMTEKDRVIEGMAKVMFAPRNDKGIVVWDTLTDAERDECINKARLTYTSNVSNINSTLRIETELSANASNSLNNNGKEK